MACLLGRLDRERGWAACRREGARSKPGGKGERVVGVAVGCGFGSARLRPLGLTKLSGSAQWREGEMGRGQERESFPFSYFLFSIQIQI